MLGKCIKNEFVNRSGLVGMISAGVMLFAVIVLGLDKLYNVVGTTAFAVFVKLVDVMFVLVMFAMIVMVVLLPCLDFRTRFLFSNMISPPIFSTALYLLPIIVPIYLFPALYPYTAKIQCANKT